MTATNEDVIQGWIVMEKKQMHPSHSSVFLRGVHTTIRIMEKTPRDLGKVQRLIDQKEAALHETDNIVKRDMLREEVNALEWLRMILRSSGHELETWASIQRHKLGPRSVRSPS